MAQEVTFTIEQQSVTMAIQGVVGLGNIGDFEYTYVINVNGVEDSTGTFDPLDSNTFNIAP